MCYKFTNVPYLSFFQRAIVRESNVPNNTRNY